ncbi:MAG: hypothetical protein RLZZ623_1530 [Actinomycetota bacterium]
MQAVETNLLAVLPHADRAAVVSQLTRRTFRKGETLFHEGDPGDTLHLLGVGRVAIRISTPEGDIATLTVLGPGTCFGEQALLNPTSRRTASAIALEPVETRVLNRADFERLRRSNPAVEQFLTGILAAQVRRLSGQLLDALYAPADRRVARRLVELARVYEAGTLPTRVQVTQQDLGSMAGTTRPTTNRVLKHFEELGLIAVQRGEVVVIDPVALEWHAG